MSNSTYRIKSCNCLQGCSEVNYKFFVASVRKFTDAEIDEMCKPFLTKQPPHFIYIKAEIEATFEHMVMKNLTAQISELSTEKCKNYIKNEYAHVRVRIDGSSFLRHGAGLKYSTSDKFALIGGTVGLFSGFSVLVVFEVIHWLVVTIKRIFYPEPASVEPEDPQEELKKLIKEENQDLKNQVKEMKEILVSKGIMPNFTADQKPLDVVNIEGN